MDHVDVQPLLGDCGGHPRDLHRRNSASQQRDHAAVFACRAHPGLVLRLRHRREVNLHAQVMPGKEQILEHRRRAVAGRNLDQETERQKIMDDRLADVEDVDRVRGQHLRQHSGQPGPVAAGDIDEDDLRHRIGSHLLR
jgi:hypothetical protein